MLDDDENEFRDRVRRAPTDALLEAYNDAMSGRFGGLPQWQIWMIDEELSRRRRGRHLEVDDDAERFIKDQLRKRQQEEAKKAKTKKKIPTKKTKTIKKEETTMATETKNIKVNTKIDVNAIMQAKMAEKMMDAVGTGKDIPLAKMAIMQGVTSGKGIDINEIIQAKQTEKLLKDLDSGKELTIGQLMTYQALTSGDGLDINALVQAKFVEKLFDETEDKK